MRTVGGIRVVLKLRYLSKVANESRPASSTLSGARIISKIGLKKKKRKTWSQGPSPRLGIVRRIVLLVAGEASFHPPNFSTSSEMVSTTSLGLLANGL